MFVRFEAREGSRSPERIPDVPGVGLARDVLDRSPEEGPFEIRLVPRRVGAADHPELRPQRRMRERVLGEQRPNLANEVRRVIAPCEEPEPPGRHRVGVDDGGHSISRAQFRQAPSGLMGAAARGRVEDHELHEEAPVDRLPHALALASILDHVDGRQAGRLRFRLAHFVP